MNNWVTAGAKIAGQDHIYKNIRCQDSFEILEKENFICLAVSDGAGSSKYADVASKIATRLTVKILEKDFDLFYSEGYSLIKKKIIHRLRTAIGIEAKKRKSTKDDFNCTLIFAAFNNEKYIIGHIGDGAVGVMINNEIQTISKPLNGEFKNQTYFVNSTGYLEHFRIYKGNIGNIDGFIVGTDGTTDSLFDYKSNKFAPIGVQIIKWLDHFTREKVNEAIENNLKEIISKKTKDDCTLVIARKK